MVDYLRCDVGYMFNNELCNSIAGLDRKRCIVGVDNDCFDFASVISIDYSGCDINVFDREAASWCDVAICSNRWSDFDASRYGCSLTRWYYGINGGSDI